MFDLSGVHVVIPTLSRARFANIRSLAASLEDLGASLSIVANGRGIHEELLEAALPVQSENRNLGFSGAVNRGARERSDWQWLLILNDDVEISDVASLVSLGSAPDGRGEILTFGDEPFLPIPGAFEVFLSLSLLTGLRRRLTARGRRVLSHEDAQRGSYFPFSAVGVSRALWDELGGLDEDFPFTYEDADFTRRALELGAVQRQVPGGGITHLRSVTGRANVDVVLPAASWAALRYLQKWTSLRRGARIVCVLGLCVRFVLLPFSRASARGHAQGTARAIRAIARNVQPALPSYERF